MEYSQNKKEKERAEEQKNLIVDDANGVVTKTMGESKGKGKSAKWNRGNLDHRIRGEGKGGSSICPIFLIDSE